MPRGRRLLAVAVLAVPLSQVGHALAGLAFEGTLLPPGARHGYFGATLEASAIVLAGALVPALVALALARRPGRRSRRVRAWPALWLFLGLVALQLELYLVQELAEGNSSADVAVRGLAGQVPVAALAALAVSWISARLRPALRRLRRPLLSPAVRLVPVPAERHPAPPALLAARRPRRAWAPRAPPRLLPLRAV